LIVLSQTQSQLVIPAHKKLWLPLSRVASVSEHRIKSAMRFVGLILAGGALFFSGCEFLHTAGDVVSAPIRLFHHPTPTPTPTPTPRPKRSAKRRHPSPQESPVSALPHPASGHSEASPAPSTKEKTSDAETKMQTAEPTATPTTARSSADKNFPTATPQQTATPATAPSPAEESFPTAKSVPDKPGYVFSPYEPTKFVDVTGYASGSKVKDPYTGKVFLVP
jgi:hypothetical protein